MAEFQCFLVQKIPRPSHDLLVTNRYKKKFSSHVVFVGGMKICFLSLEVARAKRE